MSDRTWITTCLAAVGAVAAGAIFSYLNSSTLHADLERQNEKEKEKASNIGNKEDDDELSDKEEEVAGFNWACSWVTRSASELGISDQLTLYAYYKQATEGDCLDDVGPGRLYRSLRSKWEAWASVQGLTTKEAKQEYVEHLLKCRPDLAPQLLLLDSFKLPPHDSMTGSRSSRLTGVIDGEDKSFGDSESHVMLCAAIDTNDWDAVLALLKGDPTLANATLTVTKLTPLHLAADRGRGEIVELLCSYGAIVDALDEYNDTPLHSAIVAEKLDAVKSLVANGANPRILNEDGVDCLALAEDVGNADIVNLVIGAVKWK